MKKLHVIIVLLLTLCVMYSCKSRPDYVIDEDTMTALLTDVHMAEGLLEVQGDQNRQNADYGKDVMAAVLVKYGVSKQTYDTSLVWYSQNLKQLIRIYNRVNKNLDQQEADWQLLADASGSNGPCESGDSVNVWREKDYQLIDEKRHKAFRLWTITADTTFHKGDTLRLALHVPQQPSQQGVVVSLALTAYDATTRNLSLIDGASSSLLSADTLLTLTCVGAPDAEISSVTVALHSFSQTHSAVVPSYVDSIALIRLHKIAE